MTTLLHNTQLWIKIARDATRDMAKAHVLTFFQNSELQEINATTMRIAVPREFFRKWVEEKAVVPLQQAAIGAGYNVQKVEIVVDGSLEHRSEFDVRDIISPEPDNDDAADFKTGSKKSFKRKPISKTPIENQQLRLNTRSLNSLMTFDRFIAGESSALAKAACEAAAMEPGQKYSPLFIYGGVGLGKTHLLHALGNSIAQRYPEANIMTLNTQRFVDEIVAAVRAGKAEQIRDKYRRCDVFLLDDIQFLAGKERTQEILFHLFNDLVNRGVQICFAADQPPSQLKGIAERLVSRFGSGMVVDVQEPDYETRLAILQHSLLTSNLPLSPALVEYIAEHVTGSVRNLLAVVRQLIANWELQQIQPTSIQVQSIIARVQVEAPAQPLQRANRSQNTVTTVQTLDQIAEGTAQFFDIPLEKMLSTSRKQEYTVPRQMAMYLAHRKLEMPLTQIGRFFGGRDHSTVLSSVRKFDKLAQNKHELLGQHIEQLSQELGLSR